MQNLIVLSFHTDVITMLKFYLMLNSIQTLFKGVTININTKFESFCNTIKNVFQYLIWYARNFFCNSVPQICTIARIFVFYSFPLMYRRKKNQVALDWWCVMLKKSDHLIDLAPTNFVDDRDLVSTVPHFQAQVHMLIK